MGLLFLYKDEISGANGTYRGTKNGCRDLVERTERRPIGRPRRRWASYIKEDPA
jgi:hypothetical protein